MTMSMISSYTPDDFNQEEDLYGKIHRKKIFSIYPSPAGMSLTKLSFGGNNLYMTSLFPPMQGEFGK
jgi:hypothetical protein